VIPGRPHSGDRCCIAALRDSGARFAKTGGTGHCSSCGASFRYGEVWKHLPSAEYIHLGHDCADKYGLVSGSREEALAYQKQAAEARSRNAKEKRLVAARDKFLAAEPALAGALSLRTATPNPAPDFGTCPTHGAEVPYADADGYWRDQDLRANCSTCSRITTRRNGHRDPKNDAIRILSDLYSKLHQYSSLSPKQIAFALSLGERVRTAEAPKPPAADKPKVTAPTGKQTVTGRVISTRESEGAYGVTYRMTVLVETPAGEWLCNATIPSNLFGNYRELKGKTVRFNATLEPGNDAHFVFGKRPTKGEILAVAQ
jgi:hypothetical protein